MTAASPEKTSHDQNLKNLILDFPLWALRLFTGGEGQGLPDGTSITLVREEQRKDHLNLGHRVLDLPLRVQPPDGSRQVFVLDIEVETHPRFFSLHRLARYVIDLSEQEQTSRVVPVVIFLRTGEAPAALALGTELGTYVTAKYIANHVSEMPAKDHQDRENPVARILLPCMSYDAAEKVFVAFKAVEGLMTLPMHEHLRHKYLEFVGIYAGLTEPEKVELRRMVENTPWGAPMVGWLTEERLAGKKEGRDEGLKEGKRATLLRQLDRRCLHLSPEQRARIESCAEEAALDAWLDRVLDAESVEDVLRDQLPH